MTTEYYKNKIEDVLTVKSIITVSRTDLSNHIVYGEAHDFPEIFYVHKGMGKTIVEGKEIAIHPGQIIIYAPNSFHGPKTPSVVCNGIVDIISFEMEKDFESSTYNKPITLTGEQRLLFHKIITAALPLFSKRIGVLGMISKENCKPYILQTIKNMLELFLLDIVAPTNIYPDDEFDRITDYMIKNISKTLNLKKISFDTGISISTLKRVIRNTYNTTPMAYFSSLKIQEAKRLISHTSLNFTQIAYELGYSSVHHLSRKFKQKTGMTLTEYKNTLPS